ncbi:hypothetical protein [Streptomyces sp. CS014]|uniref:hypothetical protein n=1 Tax=Streptomyces sp. CS014 TaxID=2162707 RepID=UPI000D521F4F|nr:hypothetical protein [Streptomyces sp. CS014]PVC97520.1 hypothetical protein DBP12_16280 [Streptomyces sp. CS014]
MLYPRILARGAQRRRSDFHPALSEYVDLIKQPRLALDMLVGAQQRLLITTEDAGLDGHENVVDVLVVATAACADGPMKVASTDGSHIPKLWHAASVGRNSPVEWVRV